MKKDETFEDWCNSVGGNTQIDMELSMARTHLSNCWNHQQKKIDELEKLIKRASDMVKSNSNGEFVGGVFVSHRQACIIYSEWLKEKLSKPSEKEEGEGE